MFYPKNIDINFFDIIMILIFIFSFLGYVFCSKTISLPFERQGYSYYLYFILGGSNISLVIDFSLTDLVVEYDSYDPKESNTSKLMDENYKIYGRLFKYLEYQDYISSPMFNPILITFFQEEEIDFLDFSYSGLGLHMNNINNSNFLLNKLKERYYIDKIAFTIVPPENETSKRGTFYIGDLPHSLIKSNTNIGKCYSDNSINWSCNLTGIKFSDYYYNMSLSPIIKKMQPLLVIPHKEFELFAKDYLKVNLENKSCTKFKDMLIDSDYIECNCDSIQNLPPIQLILDNYIFEFNSSMLFTKMLQSCLFKIESSFIDENSSFLGVQFLNQFITHFDYEEKSLTFYSNVVKISKKGNNNHILFCIIQIQICLLILFLPLLMYTSCHSFIFFGKIKETILY